MSALDRPRVVLIPPPHGRDLPGLSARIIGVLLDSERELWHLTDRDPRDGRFTRATVWPHDPETPALTWTLTGIESKIGVGREPVLSVIRFDEPWTIVLPEITEVSVEVLT